MMTAPCRIEKKKEDGEEKVVTHCVRTRMVDSWIPTKHFSILEQSVDRLDLCSSETLIVSLQSRLM